MKRQFRSLTRKQTYLVIVTALFFSISILILESYFVARDIRQTVIDEQSQLLASIKQPLADALWRGDSKLTNTILQQTLTLPYLRSASLSRDNKPLLELKQPNAPPEHVTWLSQILFADLAVLEKVSQALPPATEQATLNQAVPAARINLAFDLQAIDHALISRLALSFWLTLAGALLLSLVLCVLFHHFLTRPIANICQHIDNIDPEHPAKQLIVSPRQHENDELGSMSVKLNQILLKLQQTQIRLKQMATRDPLTNLPNRVLMLENIDIAIQAAERDHKKFTFLFINLNRFKTINDSLGHAIGDLFLMRIAKVLLAAVGDQGLVSRIGGDEFAILTNNITTPERAAQFVNHIMLSLNQPMQLKEHCLHPTASIGVSIYPDDAQTAEELIHNADIAMYNAKDPGYANWAFFKPQMTERANQRLRIEADLHHSLENNEFILYFQPQFDLQTAQIKGCEALLRCKKTDQLIMPTSFIQTAEETGIIIPIGRWVIEEACKMIKHWQQQYQCQIPIAVNLSSRQFEDKHLLTTIKNLSEKYQISPTLLEIEITETSIMKDLDMAIYKLQQLKNAGFSIALDDFGTGYSSLAYLRHLPISTLKIDREFVRDLPENNALASTILTLGNKLDLHIVAEGIEHDKQYQWLRQNDCQTGQGFYFNQPLSQADFEEKYIKH